MAAFWLSVGVFCCQAACSAPREPEPPGTGVQIDYLPKSSPANVWANLGKSLEATHAPGWEDNISQNEFRLYSR